MNFKDQYKKDFENIKTDDKFKAELVKQLESAKKENSKGKIYAFSGVIAAAAILAVVIGVGFHKDAKPKDNDSNGGNTMNAYVDNNEGESDTVLGMETEKWYKDAKTDEEIYDVFASLLKDDKLEKMYCSTESKFTKDNIMEESDAEDLTKKIIAASKTDKEISGDELNYMAVFEDGEIVKFQILGEKFVVLKDVETVFEIK